MTMNQIPEHARTVVFVRSRSARSCRLQSGRRGMVFLRGFLRAERGATAAEFALVVPVFLLFLFALIEGAMVLGAIHDLRTTARTTLRTAIADYNRTGIPIDNTNIKTSAGKVATWRRGWNPEWIRVGVVREIANQGSISLPTIRIRASTRDLTSLSVLRFFDFMVTAEATLPCVPKKVPGRKDPIPCLGDNTIL